MIKTIFQNLENANVEIHKHFNSLPRYTYKGNGQFSISPPSKGGIYVMFEDGEKIGNLDRIVRVGKAEQSLLTRLTQHFINEDKDHSIFRKHVGRALLQKGNYSQVDINNWNIKGIKCPQIEEKVTVELKRFSFCCIEDFSNIEEIKNLEQTLIETLSMYNRLYKKQTGKDIFSENWLGQDCTNDKVRTSGLWNDEHVRNWKKYNTREKIFMDFDFTIKMKDMISYYLKCIDTELKSENLTAQEYFERYGINQFYKSKTNVYKGGVDGMTFDFVLKKAYELGYFLNPSDNILIQVDKELKTQSFSERNPPIAECSADLD